MKIATTAAITLALGIAAASAAPLPVNVSGYEFLLGTSCTIGTCGVEFGGWTGGSGQVANGWTPFPGTGQGLWKASVNYTGKAMFGDGVHVHVVDVVGGSFDLLFTNGTTVLGAVPHGTVTWPPSGSGDIGCGVGVAVVSVNVTFTRGAMGPGSFKGCLHDLPAGSVIPPKIWGRLGALQ
jgi:hypothetical protein